MTSTIESRPAPTVEGRSGGPAGHSLRIVEREVAERFGEAWERYARETPRFLPRLQRPASPALPDKF